MYSVRLAFAVSEVGGRTVAVYPDRQIVLARLACVTWGSIPPVRHPARAGGSGANQVDQPRDLVKSPPAYCPPGDE